MSDFLRFPQTPHLAWLGNDTPRGDKLLDDAAVQALLAGPVVVEEKIDGANIGLSRGPDGALRVQNRGQYLEPPLRGQFARLAGWLATHHAAIDDALDGDDVWFGEWCAAVHSVEYDSLPDWFLLFDIYDRAAGTFVATDRRNAIAAATGLSVVPELSRGPASLEALLDLLADTQSRYASGPLEGIVIRRDEAGRCAGRGKIVRADFVQAIGVHWSRGPLRWNRLAAP